ncbi:hypothetical protein AB1Y20_014991 [Prymnesium parvum]|uniref:Uncharacterized protein n=1 Tax=Prymnesium parvum TaxID=97485 RepID=A0AB34JZ30_PRYPA
MPSTAGASEAAFAGTGARSRERPRGRERFPAYSSLGASSTPNALPYSIVESVLGPILAVDRTVIGGAHESTFLNCLILPTKFESALAQSFLEAPNVKLNPNARYTSLSAAAAAAREFADRLDATALHPAYLLTVPDTYSAEPVPNSLPAPYRSLHVMGTAVTFDSLSNDKGFLIHLSFLGFVMFATTLKHHSPGGTPAQNL